MPALTRRRLLATGAGGLAAGALAACGATEEGEDRSADADPVLLAAVGGREFALQGVYDNGGLSALTSPTRKAVYARQSERIRKLGQLGPGPPFDGETETPASGSDDPQSGIAAANDTLAAYRDAAALFSTDEGRGLALELFVSLAADLAVLREAAGEQPSPFAFVTGGAEDPIEETDPEATEEDS